MSQARNGSADQDLDAMLDRINHLTATTVNAPPAPPLPGRAASAAPPRVGGSPTPAQTPPARPAAPPQPQTGPGGPQTAPAPASAAPNRTPVSPANRQATAAPQRRPAEPTDAPKIMRVNDHADAPATAAAPQTASPASPEHPPAQLNPALGVPSEQKPPAEFFPAEPKTLHEASLNDSLVTELILKYLLARGEDSGQGIADQVKLPFTIISELMTKMKYDQLLHYLDTAKMGDYVCTLTERGRDRARGHSSDCTYYGAAPVTLSEYCDSVAAQSLTHQSPTEADLGRAFSDLLINPKMFLRLGSAMNSGRGMFLFGYPGNGKTSIAERVTRAFGEHIWIPRSIGIDGEIIRLFDPSQHQEAPLEEDNSIILKRKVDTRWVRIERPTLIVGGELTMDHLELCINPATGINEAPLQLKSNCGTLVIDDFGRQRMTTDELLNRWIVPLEKRYDFLNLPSGKKIQVPFDQLVIFSTNLEPKDLVDDAFLRRIPYKIEVENPTREEFTKLFEIMCPLMGFTFDRGCVEYLIETHYLPVKRPFRCCQPRDLLLQIKNYCKYMRRPIVLSPENFDFATANYFSVM